MSEVPGTNAGLFEEQLAQLEAGLKETPERLEGDKRAVVACILRRQVYGDNGLEMFFILRASRKNKNGTQSRWGGQVGFPGGHVEADETDEEALVRWVDGWVVYGLEVRAVDVGSVMKRLGCIWLASMSITAVWGR